MDGGAFTQISPVNGAWAPIPIFSGLADEPHAGTVLTLFANDGVTSVRSFALDDPEAPSSRT